MTNHLLNTSCNWQLLDAICDSQNAISSPSGDRTEGMRISNYLRYTPITNNDNYVK